MTTKFLGDCEPSAFTLLAPSMMRCCQSSADATVAAAAAGSPIVGAVSSAGAFAATPAALSNVGERNQQILSSRSAVSYSPSISSFSSPCASAPNRSALPTASSLPACDFVAVHQKLVANATAEPECLLTAAAASVAAAQRYPSETVIHTPAASLGVSTGHTALHHQQQQQQLLHHHYHPNGWREPADALHESARLHRTALVAEGNRSTRLSDTTDGAAMADAPIATQYSECSNTASVAASAVAAAVVGPKRHIRGALGKTDDTERRLGSFHANNGNSKLRKDLPLKLQVEVLAKLTAGARQTQVAAEFNVSQSQISRIKSNQQQILAHFLQNGNLERRRTRPGSQTLMEERLLRWYQVEACRGVLPNGVTITNKANQIAAELGLTGWKASKGWFYRWRQRNNIKIRSTTIPSLEPADPVQPGVTLAEFREVLATFNPDDVYVMDETILLYRAVPWRGMSANGDRFTFGLLQQATTSYDVTAAQDRSAAAPATTTAATKPLTSADEEQLPSPSLLSLPPPKLVVDSQERVALVLCANRSGTSLMPPVLVGRTAEPACLRGVKTYPILYTNSTGAVMTANIFHGWLQQIDSDCSKTGRKIVLVADDTPVHRVSQLVLKNVRLLYFPCHVRPLEELISQFKVFYREQLVRELAVICDHSFQTVKAASTISLLRCMHFIKRAWNRLKGNDVSSCLESLIKTVLGVNFDATGRTSSLSLDRRLSPVQRTFLEDAKLLPFGLDLNDLRCIENVEKGVEKELMHAQDALQETEDNDDFLDERLMGHSLVPAGKHEVHAAIEVLRRFYDLNGYDPSPLYQADDVLQRHLTGRGLLPQAQLVATDGSLVTRTNHQRTNARSPLSVTAASHVRLLASVPVTSTAAPMPSIATTGATAFVQRLEQPQAQLSSRGCQQRSQAFFAEHFTQPS